MSCSYILENQGELFFYQVDREEILNNPSVIEKLPDLCLEVLNYIIGLPGSLSSLEDYFDTLSIKKICCRMIPYIDSHTILNSYFANKRASISTLIKLREIECNQFSFSLMIVLGKEYTQKKDKDKLEILLELMEDYGEAAPWIEALVPYGSDDLIKEYILNEDAEVSFTIPGSEYYMLEIAFEVSKERMLHILTLFGDLDKVIEDYGKYLDQQVYIQILLILLRIMDVNLYELPKRRTCYRKAV